MSEKKSLWHFAEDDTYCAIPPAWESSVSPKCSPGTILRRQGAGAEANESARKTCERVPGELLPAWCQHRHFSTGLDRMDLTFGGRGSVEEFQIQKVLFLRMAKDQCRPGYVREKRLILWSPVAGSISWKTG